jgi:hypothetical protein
MAAAAWQDWGRTARKRTHKENQRIFLLSKHHGTTYLADAN